jgi:soluble lytic murein transglycosylase-like protein
LQIAIMAFFLIGWNKKIGRLAGIISMLAVALALAPAAQADIFMYAEPDGSVHFSNIPTDGRYEVVLRDAGAATGEPAVVARQALKKSHPARERFAPIVAKAAADSGLPEDLLHAMVQVESNYNPSAVSRKGAVGLMQLMPDTARQYGVADARDPVANLVGGARYLRDLLALFKNDLSIALAAYNAGPGAVLKNGSSIPPYAETQRYVPKVMDLYGRVSVTQ